MAFDFDALGADDFADVADKAGKAALPDVSVSQTVWGKHRARKLLISLADHIYAQLGGGPLWVSYSKVHGVYRMEANEHGKVPMRAARGGRTMLRVPLDEDELLDCEGRFSPEWRLDSAKCMLLIKLPEAYLTAAPKPAEAPPAKPEVRTALPPPKVPDRIDGVQLTRAQVVILSALIGGKWVTSGALRLQLGMDDEAAVTKAIRALNLKLADMDGKIAVAVAPGGSFVLNGADALIAAIGAAR